MRKSSRSLAVEFKKAGRKAQETLRWSPGLHLLRVAQTGIFFAVQLPQSVFMDRVLSSKIVVQCDMHTCIPHSAQAATA